MHQSISVFVRFWGFNGIIVRRQPYIMSESTLIFYHSFIHRRLPRRVHRARRRRQDIKPGFN
jgi:hypothetical protein